MTLKTDLSKTKFPQDCHYNSKLSWSSHIFLKRYKILVQKQCGTYLAFRDPKTFYRWGALFSNSYSKTLGIMSPLFRAGWVTCLETWTGTDTRKQNRNGKLLGAIMLESSEGTENQEILTQELHVGERVVSEKGSVGTSTWFAYWPWQCKGSSSLGCVSWNVKGSETAKVKTMNHWSSN